MSESNEYISKLPQSDLTAEQLLSKLAELITDITDADQLTNALIESAFDIRLEPYDGDYDYAARLTPEWNVSIVVRNDELAGRIVEFGFFDSNEETTADMTDICGVDSDVFGRAMLQAGFELRASHGVHGERRGNEYRRGSVQVSTLTQGEANQPHEKIAHECITSVRIQRHE